jgi:hypothetical protein
MNCSRCASASTRSTASCWPAEPPRRAGAGGRRTQEARGLGGVPARARGAGDRRPEGRQPGPAACRQRGARSGARSCRPAARWSRRRGWPTWGRPAPSAKRRRWASSARRSRACPAAASTRCSADHRRRGRLRRGADRELVRRRRGQGARPVPDTPLVHHRRDQPVRAPQPAAQGPNSLAGHRGRRGAPAGAGAVPRLAQHHLPQVERRPVSSNAEGAGWPAWTHAGRHRQRAGGREFGLHRVARRSRTTPTTAPASSS